MKDGLTSSPASFGSAYAPSAAFVDRIVAGTSLVEDVVSTARRREMVRRGRGTFFYFYAPALPFPPPRPPLRSVPLGAAALQQCENRPSCRDEAQPNWGSLR